MLAKTLISLRLAAASAVFAVESQDVSSKISDKRSAAEEHLKATKPTISDQNRSDALDWAWDRFGPFLNEHSYSDALTETPEEQ
jgi:hypothetical protein